MIAGKIKKAVAMARTEGLVHVLQWAHYLLKIRLRRLQFTTTYPYYRYLKQAKFFTWEGKSYQLFWHKYNATWLNERATEIPIIQRVIDERRGARTLEVGNVLSNYFKITHDVLDKYDLAPGVISADVIDFRPQEKYDLIVSVSTIEHVGFDEEIKDTNKVIRALENLKNNCLRDGGQMVMSFPLGYNTHLDKLNRDRTLGFSKVSYLKRINRKNDWQTIDPKEVLGARYNFPFPFANVIAIGIYNKP